MARLFQSNIITATILLSITAFSCSMPLFSKTATGVGKSASNGFTPKPAKLSGVLDLHGSCAPGFYQIRLQGLFEGANTQVESQSDQSGHFSLLAPPGNYLMQIVGDGCGAKQTVELEENTEHMISVVVSETKSIEKVGLNQNEGRLPASILIEPKR